MKAPLPLREQPVTPRRLVSMPESVACSSVVDKAAHTPRPRRQGTGAMARAEERVEATLTARRARRLRGEVVVVEVDRGHAGGDRERRPTDGDDGRNGPLPDGFLIEAVKETDLPPWVMATVMPVPLTVPLDDSGGPGYSPSSYCCSALLISWRRQSQSALVVTLLPLAKVNGSGSLALLTAAMLAGTAHAFCWSKKSLAGRARAEPARRMAEARCTIVKERIGGYLDFDPGRSIAVGMEERTSHHCTCERPLPPQGTVYIFPQETPLGAGARDGAWRLSG